MLYNEDGTEYKPVIKTVSKPVVQKPHITPSTLPKVNKPSLFDLMDEKKLEDFSIEELAQDEQETEIEDTTPPTPTAPTQKVPKFLFELFGDMLKVEVS